MIICDFYNLQNSYKNTVKDGNAEEWEPGHLEGAWKGMEGTKDGGTGEGKERRR